jgi:hypothetical protein
MKKALELLFGIKPANEPLLANMNYKSYDVIDQPDLQSWCSALHVGALADKQSKNVPIIMGNRIKYVDLHSIKSL